MEKHCSKPESRGFYSRWVHWEFSLTFYLLQFYGPEFDSESNENGYGGYLLALGVRE